MNADRLAFGVPNELQEIKGWLLWKKGQVKPDGKFDKIPYYISGGKRFGTQGSPEDRAKLVTFDMALARLRKGGYDGLGLAMLGWGIVGTDYDDCRDGAGIIAPWVLEQCHGTYAEVSPSGTGVRAFFLGTFPDRKNHAAHIEVFCRTGFLTVTGSRLNGCDLAELPKAVAEELVRRLGPDKARSDSEVLGKACAQDPTLARLKELGLALRDMRDGKFDITCPFEASHSITGGAGDTVYFPAHTGGFSFGNFDCKHSHCSERPQAEFRRAIGLGARNAEDEEPPIEAYEEEVARAGASASHRWEADEDIADSATAAGDRFMQIVVRAGELPRIVQEAIKALRGAAVPIYDRGGVLYRPVRNETPPKEGDVVRRPAGAVVLRLVDAIWVRVKLAASAEWQKWDAREKKPHPADPPRGIAEIIATQSDLGNWDSLRGVVSHPVLTPEGRVISTPGYDRDTGLLIEITGSGPIPVAPTRDDSVRAWVRLKQLLRHYPWVNDADRAVALSLLLTAIARPVLPAAPMHCMDSPEAGSGKSLLVDAAAILASGGPASVMDFGRDAVEAGKRLDAMMLAGDPLIAIDNVEAPLEGAVLCQMLSQPARRIRVLGTHQVVTVPCVQLVVATGCNLTLRGDIVRRVIICRLDPKTDRPELRVINQDLMAEVSESRRELVGDLITMMLAYQRAGHPDTGVSPLGGFGAWSRMVRQALIWVGEADPCQSMDRIRGDDPSRQKLALVLGAWRDAYGDEPATSAEVVARAKHDAKLREALAVVCEKRGELDTRSLGYWLRAHRDRRSGALVLRAAPGRAGASRWAVSGGDGGDSCDVSSLRAESVTTKNKEGVGTSQTSQPSPPPALALDAMARGVPFAATRAG